MMMEGAGASQWAWRSRPAIVGDVNHRPAPFGNSLFGEVLLKVERLLGDDEPQRMGPTFLACSGSGPERTPLRPLVGLLFHQCSAQEAFAFDLAVSIDAAGADVLGIGCSRPFGEHSDFASALSRCREGGVEAVLSTLPLWSGQAWSSGPSLVAGIGVPFVEIPPSALCQHAGPSAAGSSMSTAGFDVTMMPELADLAFRAARLRRRSNVHKRVAIALPAASMTQGLSGDLAGMAAAISVVTLLYALRHAGFRVDRIPHDGQTMVGELIDATPAAVMGRSSTTSMVSPRLRLDLGNVLVMATAAGSRGGLTDPGWRRGPALTTGRRLAEEWDADAVVHLGRETVLQWLPQPDRAGSGRCHRRSLGDPLTVVDDHGAAWDRRDLVLALSPPTPKGQVRLLRQRFAQPRAGTGSWRDSGPVGDSVLSHRGEVRSKEVS